MTVVLVTSAENIYFLKVQISKSEFHFETNHTILYMQYGLFLCSFYMSQGKSYPLILDSLHIKNNYIINI